MLNIIIKKSLFVNFLLIINLFFLFIFAHNIYAADSNALEVDNNNLSAIADQAVNIVDNVINFFNNKFEAIKWTCGATSGKRFGVAFLKDAGKLVFGPLYLRGEDYYNKNFANNKRPWWWTTFLWDAPEIETEEIKAELAKLKLEETQNAQHIIDYKYTPLTPLFNIDTPVAKFKNVALTRYDVATTGITSVKASSKLLLFRSVLSNRNDFLIDHILQNSRNLENILKEYKTVSADKKLSSQIFKKMLSEEQYFSYILPVNILRSCALDIFANYLCDSYCEKINIKLLASNREAPDNAQKITNFGSVFNKFTSFTTYLLYFIKKNEYLKALILDGNQAYARVNSGIENKWKENKQNDTVIAQTGQSAIDTISRIRKPKLFTTIPNMLSSFLPLNLIKQKVGHNDTIDSAISLIGIYLKYLFLCHTIDSFAALNWEGYVFERSDIFLDLVIQYNAALDSCNEDDIEICRNLISVFVIDGNKFNFTFNKFYNFAKSFIFERKTQWVQQGKIQFLFLSIAALLYGKQTLGIIKKIGSCFISKKGINSFLNLISLD